MTATLESVLARVGLRVDAAEFLAMIEAAARRLSPQNPDPGDYFSPRQRAALTDAGLDLSPRTDDEPDARARTVAAQAVLAESALTAVQAARALGVDPSRIRHKLAAGRLTGWKEPGGWRLPAWQFTRNAVLPGLGAVLAAVPADQPALVLASFMTTPQADLMLERTPATPRQWLLAGGDPAPVAALASTLGTPV
ncbi:MAG TPA: DNA-binding protein [Amycolatopsis sp.]|uniref:DNA-binding protein n=1 Tax=Amycolatopsis sp. TaxID=37632 RepID=UPI002B466B72|nr:DNA-binding protein [Amycolatopsis sp.]HKS43795.1 DNA-binding protein [Amycolatopsis sp.]